MQADQQPGLGNTAFHQDATQQRRFAELFQDTASAMVQGLLVFDADEILFTNPQFNDLLNLPEELLEPGWSWRDFLIYSAERGDYGDPEYLPQGPADS